MTAKRRTILQMKNVQYGDLVCIYELKKDVYTITLSFDDEFPLLDLQQGCPEESSKEARKQFVLISDKIRSLGEAYTKCDYLFTLCKDELKLLSYSQESIPFSYKLTKILSEKLELPLLEVTWVGEYSHAVSFVFLEDIFVQRRG